MFGYEYAEEGLVQQIRLPVSLKVQKPRQQETFSRTLDGKTLRGASQAEQLKRLVSRSFPESFHLALYAALKHRNLCIDNVAYRCEGGYRQTDPVGKSQLMQGSADLYVEQGILRNDSPLDARIGRAEESGLVLFEAIEGLTGAGLYIQNDSTKVVQPIVASMLTTSGVYRLLVRATEETYVGVYVDGRLAVQNRVPAGTLARLDEYLLLPGGSVVTVLGRAVSTDLTADQVTPTNFFVEPVEGSFSNEFGPGFT